MSFLSKPFFHDETAAVAKLESILWGDEPVCPHCGGVGKSYQINGAKTRAGLRKCGHCRKQFTVKVGTVFESSHIPLHKWLQATYLLCSSKKGISSHQLHRTLEITYKSAWFLSHRLREAMSMPGEGPLGGPDQILEVDETFLGQQPYEFVSENRAGKPGWRKKSGTSDLTKVLTLVERGGRARSVVIDNLQAATIGKNVLANASTKSRLMTDEAKYYGRVGKRFVSHETVNHGEEEYARGDVTTNTVEGFFSIFKRGMKGIYQHCGDRHLHRYLVEFDFRYSNRVARGVDDGERFELALKGIVGKRLTYRRIGGDNAAV